MGSLDIAHPRIDRIFRIVKIAHWSSRSVQAGEYLTDGVPDVVLTGYTIFESCDDLAIGTTSAF